MYSSFVSNIEVPNKRLLNALDKLFLPDNDESFSVNIRSLVRVKQSKKRYFAVPSIAYALLNFTEEKLIGDLETFVFLFETMVERDLKIYANSFDAKCYHYQNYLNREINLIEIKLGVNAIEEVAKNLISIRDSIKENNCKKNFCFMCNMLYD